MSIKGKKRFEAIDTNLLIKLSGKDAKQWVKTQKKNVLYSRLLELEKQILLNPNNSHHLFMPIVDDIIASPETGVYGKIYVEVEGNPVSDSPDLINSLMPHTQVKNGIIFVKGKFGVGIVALAITGHSTSQADNVVLNDFYIKGDDSFDTMLRFEGMEDNYSLNNYTDNENNIITEFLSQLLTTQVDNVKNPVGIKLGINNQTLNVVEYLNRRGVGPETIIAFIKQPLIQEYLIEQRINESVLYKSLDKEVNKSSLIDTVLSRHYSQQVIKEQFNKLLPTAFINKQNLISSIKNKTFDINQIQYFNYFLELIDQSRYLSDFSQEQTADTKSIKNKTGYESVVELIDRSTRSQIVPIEIQTNVRTSGVIAPFTLARQNYYTKFKDMYLTNHNSIFNSFTEYKKTLVSIQKTKSKKEKVGTTFENDFVLYFAMKYVLKNIDPNYYDKLFGLKGYTSLAERVIEAKDKFENNIVLNAFLPLLKTREDEVTNDYLNNLRLFEREINNTDANDLINSTKELAEQDPQLFRDLVVFSLIQSGFNNSPFNYLKIIPQGLNSKRGSVEEYEYIINDIVNDSINAIHASIANNTIKQDIDQYFIEFQRNNPQYLRTKAWKNYPLNFTIGFEKGKMKLFSYDPNDYRQKTEVPIYGSTYHKRYGLGYSSNIIDDPNGKTEEDSKQVKNTVRQYTPENITSLKPNEVFVFGSNTEGRHGKGAALTAKQKFGAIYGQASGLQGQSYAIITKDLSKGEKSIPLKTIRDQIDNFIDFAKTNPNMVFYVTKLGSSLAGYSVEEIKQQFGAVDLLNSIPNNVILPKEYEVRDEGPIEKPKMREEQDNFAAGVLAMQPNNIKKIKSGTKTQTIRRQNIPNGEYSLPDGTKIQLSLKGIATVVNNNYIQYDRIVNPVSKIEEEKSRETLNMFAQKEGFKDWNEFRKDNLFSSNFIDGIEKRYVYDIKISNNANQLQTSEDKVVERMNADFDSLFPQYEYFTKEQKQAASDVVADNKTPIECKFTPGKGGNKFGR